MEKELGPGAVPVDPSLPAFEQCLALKKQLKLQEARMAFARFLEQYPVSTKLDEAREQLGELNCAIFLSPVPSPEKEEYIVKPGDVLTKVAGRLKTTPEYLVRANRLSGTMLRIGQRLVVARGSFSLVLDRVQGRVTLLRDGKFFKQYAIIGGGSAPATGSATGRRAAVPVRKQGKVGEKSAWTPDGHRVTLADKEYQGAVHWIAVEGGGSTLYAVADTEGGKSALKPAGGVALGIRDTEELAALLRKGDPVTIISLN
jgi:LysM repeat protein